jgi:hypothetical protein
VETPENRLRKIAERKGFILIKAQSTDDRFPDYGCYGLYDPKDKTILGTDESLSESLDFVEHYLSGCEDVPQKDGEE